MNSEILSDYAFAQRLHKELNGEAHSSPPPVINTTKIAANDKKKKLGGNVSVIVLSDDDETGDTLPPPRERSRSPLIKTKVEVSIVNQQAITVSLRIYLNQIFFDIF
jgi:hypothetical protein